MFKPFFLCTIAILMAAGPLQAQAGGTEMSAETMKRLIDSARGRSDTRGLRPRSDSRELRYNDHAGSEGGADIYAPQPQGGPTGSDAKHLFDLHILFATGSAELDYRSFAQLLELVKVMNDPELRSLRFAVVGHTDSVGSADRNLLLSQRRAASVREYLTVKGIDGGRLDIAGRGEYEPIDPVEGPNARNRRVEFQLVN